MKEDKHKPGLLGRITGFISNLFGAEPAPKTTHRPQPPQRPSGAGPAVKIPRTGEKPSVAARGEAAVPIAEPPTGHLTDVSFDSFDLAEPVRRGLVDAGFRFCTPVQAKAVPLALDGRDVAAQAQTGTGKTAAFLVATFTRLLRNPGTQNEASPRAFFLAPTRELVAQIENDAKKLGAHTGLRIHAVYGGVDYGLQRDILRKGVDVLIGTPGRLIDYYKQNVYNLDGVEVLVIDEADRMFDMGFLPDLRYLLKKLPPYDRRQSMLFSATLSYRVMELAYEHMNLPERIEIAPEQKTAERVEQRLYHVGGHEKFRLLLGLLRRDGGKRILIFVNTKVGAEAIVRKLEANGYRSAELSGDIPQPRRLKVLAQFKTGELPILVATDVAARGLHIEGVTHVYNYDIPLDAEDYVHRIGRTARAGASGHAIALACERYVAGLEPIQAYIGMKIPVEWADDSLFVDEKAAAPRQFDRHGGSRADHGDGGGGHRGRRGPGRPDRTDRVAGHHVSKDFAVEAELEAKGRIRDEVPERLAPRADHGPRSDRGRRDDRNRRPDRGPRPDRPARPARGPVAFEEPGGPPVELSGAEIEELRFRDEVAPVEAPAAGAPPQPGGTERARRRRRRGGRAGGEKPGTPVSSAADDDGDSSSFFVDEARVAPPGEIRAVPLTEGGAAESNAPAEAGPGGAKRRRGRRRGGRGRRAPGAPGAEGAGAPESAGSGDGPGGDSAE